jgi:hypothetical protein
VLIDWIYFLNINFLNIQVYTQIIHPFLIYMILGLDYFYYDLRLIYIIFRIDGSIEIE